MAIDLLGNETKKPAKKEETSSDVKMHLPEAERRRREQEKKMKEIEKKKEEVKEEAFKEVNLILSFKKYLFKKRLTFGVLLVIIILLVGGLASYFVLFYKPAPNVEINKPVSLPPPPIINQNVNQAVIQPAVCGNNILEDREECDDGNNISGDGCTAFCIIETTPPLPPQPPTPPPPPPLPPTPPVILPDTELTPLRGSLVQFQGEIGVYLVENNGELRLVDVQTVVFKNGQRINQISKSLIYTLANRFKNIRKGKDVVGLVDWDPRNLTALELKPFLE